MLIFNSGVAWLPPLAVAVAIIGSTVLLATGRWLPRVLVDWGSVVVAAAVTGMAATVLYTSAGGRVVTWSAGWLPHQGFSVGIVLESDPVGAGIALVAAALTTCALVYSVRYYETVDAHFQGLLLLFLAGMVGFAFTADLFDMFVFFELMGAAAYALTGFKVEDPTAVQGAFNFGVINSLGAYLGLTGVGLVYARTGNLGMPQAGAALAHHHVDALVVAAFVLTSTAFLVKGAAAPFHFWLADAHAVAPTPVCLLFSGVMVPLGVYGAFRVYWVVFSQVLPAGDVRRLYLVLGVVTAVLGAVMCLGQRHIKRLLAYSTIGHVGLFLCALGVLSPAGVAGALLYVAGHAGAKGALFLLAGLLLNRYGSVDEHALYGRGRSAQVVPWLWVAGAFALAALPPFGTGLGKAIGEEAAGDAGFPLLMAVFVFTSAVTGGAVLRVVGRVFFSLGPRPEDPNAAEASPGEEQPEAGLTRVPLSMLVPIVLLLLGCLVEGVMPGGRAAADHAGALFTDVGGYVGAALHHRAGLAPAARKPDWTALGIGLDVLSAVLAVGVAAAGLYGSRAAEHLHGVGASARRAYSGLHRLHSGHIGDYVTWLLTGVTAMALLLGLWRT
ncbi:MAG TPA: complex I subunit 5 family protein [Acidimicrobiales bacterium]|nr:complex I subunit 5 family protein [Acidimicrobiales bacterium]